MNPLTNVKNITKLNEIELAQGTSVKKSWHDMYSDSAWIFIGGLSYGLTEGDVLAVFSQYGEIVNLNMVRDKETGKIKGYGFICYANQKSTVLAVDNLNAIKLCGRTIRVDHVANYRIPKEHENDDEITKSLYAEGCAPKPLVKSEPNNDDMEVLPLERKKNKKKKHKEHRLSSERDTSSHKKGMKKEVKIKVEKHDSGYDKYMASTSKSNHGSISGQKQTRRGNDEDSDEPSARKKHKTTHRKSNHSPSPCREEKGKDIKNKHKKTHQSAGNFGDKYSDSVKNHKTSHNDRRSDSRNGGEYQKSEMSIKKEEEYHKMKTQKRHRHKSSSESVDSDSKYSHKQSSKKKHASEYKNSGSKQKHVDPEPGFHKSSSRLVSSKNYAPTSSGSEEEHFQKKHKHKHYDEKASNELNTKYRRESEHSRKYEKSHRDSEK